MLSGPPDEEIRRLKGRPGSDIVCTGSITLVHELIEAGLVDEVPPLRAPGRVGIRPPAVRAGAKVADLELVKVQPFRAGVVPLVYRVR